MNCRRIDIHQPLVVLPDSRSGMHMNPEFHLLLLRNIPETRARPGCVPPFGQAVRIWSDLCGSFRRQQARLLDVLICHLHVLSHALQKHLTVAFASSIGTFLSVKTVVLLIYRSSTEVITPRTMPVSIYYDFALSIDYAMSDKRFQQLTSHGTTVGLTEITEPPRNTFT
jgi:hypothetical protein